MARTSCRLPLGVPSQLVLTAMDLAGRLIGVPQSKAAAAQVPMRLLQCCGYLRSATSA